MAVKRSRNFQRPKKKEPDIPTARPSRVKSRGTSSGPFQGVEELQNRRNRVRKATGHKPFK